MPQPLPDIDPQVHRPLAVKLFNRTWELLDKTDRTADDVDELLHSAHASRLHWMYAGNAENAVIGEWQVSRVYAVLSRFEPARHHAERALALATENQIQGFNLGICYEALARAWSLQDAARAREHLQHGWKIAETITDADDRKVLEDDLRAVENLLE